MGDGSRKSHPNNSQWAHDDPHGQRRHAQHGDQLPHAEQPIQLTHKFKETGATVAQ